MLLGIVSSIRAAEGRRQVIWRAVLFGFLLAQVPARRFAFICLAIYGMMVV